MNICPPQNFVEYFRSAFVYFLLVASVASSCAVLISRPVSKYDQYAIESEIREVVAPVRETEEQFDFVICSFGSSEPQLMPIAEVAGELLMTVLFAIPATAVLVFVSVFATLFPCLDTAIYLSAASVSFIFYTAYYWLSIGYLIYNTPGDWGPFREDLKMLSILDDGKR